jgi:hypothetical protein
MTEQESGVTKAQVADYLRRHKRYDNIDGTGEMFFGAMYLAFALDSYVSAALPQGTFYQKGLGQFVVMYGILIPVFCLVAWGSKAIKRHITWPRTGYVAPLKVTRSSSIARMVFVAALAAAAAGVFAMVRWGRLPNGAMLQRIAWLAMAVACYAVAAHWLSKEHPWKFFVALFMAAGLAAYAIARPDGSNAEFFRPVMVFTGMVWMASGGATLYLYIRRTAPPAAGSE